MAFQWNPRVMDEALELAGAGLEAATIFLEGAVKETLSVPAPRITLTDKKGGKYYVAGYKLSDPKRFVTHYIKGAKQTYATSYKFPRNIAGQAQQGPPSPFRVKYQTAPAIKGDPPRKLSGKLRREVTHEMLEPMRLFEGGTLPKKGRVGTNTKYARRLEFGPGGHGFLDRTATKYWSQIRAVIDNAI